MSPTKRALEYPYPYFASVMLSGAPIGRSDYHAFNLRVQKRFSRGYGFLVNYTLSRLKDNTGGPNASGGQLGNANAGTGFREMQSVDELPAFGLSPLDETHRLVASFNAELPFGRGRKFLSSPQGAGGKILDFVIGGWGIAGISLYRSGRPIVFPHYIANNEIRVESTFASFANPNDRKLTVGGDHGKFFIGGNPVTADTPRRFVLSKFKPAALFTYGTLPPVFEDFRHQGNIRHDLSLMKKFSFTSDGSRFFQLRMEATNFFNIRGLGGYDTDLNSSNFGLITAPGNQERRVQVSARIVF